MNHRNKPYLAGVLLLSIMFILGACGSSSQRSPNRASASGAAAPAPVSATLACQDCVEAGIVQANIFAGSDLNALACRERWGTRVQILDTSTKEGVAIYQVKTPSCTGWVSSRLVQR